MSELRVPRAAEPLVSIVMVTYGAGEWAERALRGVAEHTDPMYEVVVTDNASPDGTGARLRERIDGIDLLLNERNLGFGPAANQGAARTRGRLLCFLNPDTLVEEGWLLPLTEAVEEAGVGAAVPLLLDLDGTLQEAGSIVGGDGATHALGRGDDPDGWSMRGVMTVDYGSAACLVVRRAAFEQVGGFDPAYQPAYCEDVDLGLALRSAGYRTVVEPRSRVRHARAASVGLERAHRLTLANRPRLLARWGRSLADRPPLEDLSAYPHRIVAARDHDATDRLLFLAEGLPHEADVNLLVRLARTWPDVRLTVLVERGLADEARSLTREGIEVAIGVEDVGSWLDARRFHHTVVAELDPGMLARHDAALRQSQPQAVRWDPHGRDSEHRLARAGVAPPEGGG